MNTVNYQKELEKIIRAHEADITRPSLLLHACCAPCSSYVLDYLSELFDITVMFYNPNIFPESEFVKRENELKRLIAQMNSKNPIKTVVPPYDPNEFFNVTKGYEGCAEGGERCARCFRLRLSASAKYAAENNFDYLTTTLTISPLKNAALLNAVGNDEAKKASVCWLPSDFKKHEGYKRSIELSKKYNLYRQNYCGCVFSKQQSENK